jgi:hypothetical protein
MNPSFLLKDELQYELRISGISSDADIRTLRKLFRSVVLRDLPVDLSNLNSLRVEDLYGSVASKIIELQSLLTQTKSSLSLLTPRLRSRISHLRGRLTHLTTLGLFPSTITTSHNQEFNDQLDLIEQHVASREVADQQSQEQERQEDMYNMAHGASRTHPSLLPGKVGDRLGADDRQDTRDVSTVTVDVTKHTDALPAHVAQAEAGLPSLGQSANQVFNPHFYISEAASVVERTPCGRRHRCKPSV